MLKKTKIKIGAAIATGLMGFAAIGTSVGIINNDSDSHMILKTNKSNSQIDSNSKIINYSSYLKDSSFSKVKSAICQNIDQKSTMFLVVTKKQEAILKYTDELKIKVTEIAKKIFNNKIDIKDLINEINKKYNSLSKSDKNFIKNEISKKNSEKKKINLMFNVLSFYSVANATDQNLTNAQTAYKQSEKLERNLKIFGGLTTAAAIASTAIAAAIWAIPFYGWVAEGFATADTAVDWVTVGITWAQYANVGSASLQMGSVIENFLTAPLGVSFIGNDLSQFLWGFNKMRPILLKLVASINADWATNLAGAFAEPEVASWYDTAIGVISGLIDISTAIYSGLTFGGF